MRFQDFQWKDRQVRPDRRVHKYIRPLFILPSFFKQYVLIKSLPSRPTTIDQHHFKFYSKPPKEIRNLNGQIYNLDGADFSADTPSDHNFTNRKAWLELHASVLLRNMMEVSINTIHHSFFWSFGLRRRTTGSKISHGARYFEQ
jgi:hypothetical protein